MPIRAWLEATDTYPIDHLEMVTTEIFIRYSVRTCDIDIGGHNDYIDVKVKFLKAPLLHCTDHP